MRIRGFVVGGLTLVAVFSASSAAMAQNCAVVPGSVVSTGVFGGIPFTGTSIATLAAATSAEVSAAVANASTAFQAQQGAAFVSAPPNPPPSSQGGGVWTKLVGGEATLTGSSSSNFLQTAVPGGLNFTQTATLNCANSDKVTFDGFQIGADSALLNWNGWNFHIGTSASFLDSNTTSNVNAFTSNVQVPSVSTYLVATYGRFFSDLSVRGDFYNITLNNPALGFNNQAISGRGTAIGVDAGYNFALPNNWFIEPSAGFTWSRTKFDAFTSAGSPPGTPENSISGVVALNDITSELGRATVRGGVNIQAGQFALQPFASVSVFREFAGNVTANYATCPNCVFFGAANGLLTASTSTTRVGTYEQYSVGLAGQIVDTGWLGFVRVDYRDGSNINGWTGNGGIRYQFTPELIAAPKFPTKAPVKAPPMIARVFDWTGFYIGPHGGVGYGRDDIAFVGTTQGTTTHFAGPLGGGQIGYNYELPNKFVLGVEGDASWANLKGGSTCGLANGRNAGGFPIAGPGGFSPFYMTCNDDITWLATATARLGYAWGDRTLLFVKAGAAFAHDTVTANCIISPAFNTPAPGNILLCADPAGKLINSIAAGTNRFGWTAGFGSEFAITDHWSAKAEYDYIGFGSKTGVATDGTLLSSKATVQVTKVGLNYHFTPGSMAMAKY